MTQIIGLMGAAGAGKSTVAQFLSECQRFERLSFAAPIKIMLKAGFDVAMRNLFGSLSDKSEPLECFGGKSTRDALQTLGTDWGRALWPYIWVYAAEQRIKINLDGRKLVLEDVRFANEVEMIRRHGGQIWLVRRETAEARIDTHASEQYWRLADPDRTIDNNGAFSDLYQTLESIL